MGTKALKLAYEQAVDDHVISVTEVKRNDIGGMSFIYLPRYKVICQQ